MTQISTVEQLKAFTSSRAPHGTITGELAARISGTVGSGADSLPISYERKEHRDMNRDVIAVSEVHWVHFGRDRIDLGQILGRLGIE
jgi:trans-2-enoyl-CoA reductase